MQAYNPSMHRAKAEADSCGQPVQWDQINHREEEWPQHKDQNRERTDKADIEHANSVNCCYSKPHQSEFPNWLGSDHYTEHKEHK